MNFKLSISFLISSAYFLTLFIVKVVKTQDILGTILLASTYSILLFLAIYILLQYIEYSFEDLKKKEAQDALEQIAKIEKEFKMKQKRDLDNRLKEIMEKDKMNSIYEEYEDKEYEDVEYEDEEYEDKKDELKKLKRDSGTQFDSRFIEQGGPNI